VLRSPTVDGEPFSVAIFESAVRTCTCPPYLRRRKLQTKSRNLRRTNGADKSVALVDAFWLDAFMRSSNTARASAVRHPPCRLATAALVCVLGAAILAGCSTSDGVSSYIIDPAHYSVYHCDGLVARLRVLLSREQELSNLMDKASEGGGGALIGNLSYRADYENMVGEEKVLRRTAAEKKCELPAPLSPTTPTPAVYSAPAAVPPSGGPPVTATVPIFQSDQTIR